MGWLPGDRRVQETDRSATIPSFRQLQSICHRRTVLPYSQACKLRRICSQGKDFSSNDNRMKDILIGEPYLPALIDYAIPRAASLDSNQLLQGACMNDSNNSRASLLITFTSSTPNINQILKKHFNILHQSEELQNFHRSSACGIQACHKRKGLSCLLCRQKYPAIGLQAMCVNTCKLRGKQSAHIRT